MTCAESANFQAQKRRAKLTLQENRITTNEGHDEASCESIPRTERLPEALVRQKIAIEALSITSFLPFDKRESHDREVYQLTSCHKADKPIEHNRRVVGEL